ncbi:c-type cytochrome [Halioxenophilus aromaticivorans]|uniref:Cytochrome c n=1 Tax=Halioxenophilus aromaticivorans TaxID=1306992 RepID=A0AAV3U4P4_9ALTE
MRKTPLTKALLGGAVACTLLLTMANSLADTAEITEQRQAGFKTMGKSVKAIRNALKAGDTTTPAVKDAAAAINQEASQLAQWFPEGSGPESGLSTDALPYIWKNTEKFQRISQDLISASAELVSALDAGADIDAPFKTVLKTCKGCHQSYRAD